jgi:hypothetical protein
MAGLFDLRNQGLALRRKYNFAASQASALDRAAPSVASLAPPPGLGLRAGAEMAQTQQGIVSAQNQVNAGQRSWRAARAARMNNSFQDLVNRISANERDNLGWARLELDSQIRPAQLSSLDAYRQGQLDVRGEANDIRSDANNIRYSLGDRANDIRQTVAETGQRRTTGQLEHWGRADDLGAQGLALKAQIQNANWADKNQMRQHNARLAQAQALAATDPEAASKIYAEVRAALAQMTPQTVGTPQGPLRRPAAQGAAPSGATHPAFSNNDPAVQRANQAATGTTQATQAAPPLKRPAMNQTTPVTEVPAGTITQWDAPVNNPGRVLGPMTLKDDNAANQQYLIDHGVAPGSAPQPWDTKNIDRKNASERPTSGLVRGFGVQNAGAPSSPALERKDDLNQDYAQSLGVAPQIVNRKAEVAADRKNFALMQQWANKPGANMAVDRSGWEYKPVYDSGHPGTARDAIAPPPDPDAELHQRLDERRRALYAIPLEQKTYDSAAERALQQQWPAGAPALDRAQLARLTAPPAPAAQAPALTPVQSTPAAPAAAAAAQGLARAPQSPAAPRRVPTPHTPGARPSALPWMASDSDPYAWTPAGDSARQPWLIDANDGRNLPWLSRAKQPPADTTVIRPSPADFDNPRPDDGSGRWNTITLDPASSTGNLFASLQSPSTVEQADEGYREARALRNEDDSLSGGLTEPAAPIRTQIEIAPENPLSRLSDAQYELYRQMRADPFNAEFHNEAIAEWIMAEAPDSKRAGELASKGKAIAPAPSLSAPRALARPTQAPTPSPAPADREGAIQILISRRGMSRQQAEAIVAQYERQRGGR